MNGDIKPEKGLKVGGSKKFGVYSLFSMLIVYLVTFFIFNFRTSKFDLEQFCSPLCLMNAEYTLYQASGNHYKK